MPNIPAFALMLTPKAKTGIATRNPLRTIEIRLLLMPVSSMSLR
jgi:hypothetical protein